MKDVEVNDEVTVRGMDTVHIVESIIGRTNQVHIKCTVTGKVLEYVDVSALTIIPTLESHSEQPVRTGDDVSLGDTVVAANTVNRKVYTVIGMNLSNGTYDLCNVNTKEVIKNVHNASVVKHVEPVKRPVRNGSLVKLNGYSEVFTVVSVYEDVVRPGTYVDILQLVKEESHTYTTRIDGISIDAVHVHTEEA